MRNSRLCCLNHLNRNPSLLVALHLLLQGHAPCYAGQISPVTAFCSLTGLRVTLCATLVFLKQTSCRKEKHVKIPKPHPRPQYVCKRSASFRKLLLLYIQSIRDLRFCSFKAEIIPETLNVAVSCIQQTLSRNINTCLEIQTQLESLVKYSLTGSPSLFSRVI